jgi:Family of unknown function (DUF6510)
MMEAIDGNGTAGALGMVFAREPTTAATVCDGCGAARPLAELVVYAGGPGMVLRCRDCEQVMIRVAELGDRVVLDVRGCRSLTFA